MNEHYGTIAGGNDYFRLSGEFWKRATDTEKESALIEATRAIERLNFTATGDAGPLHFSITDTPDDIAYATYEEANTLLDQHEDVNDITDALRVVEDRFAAVVTKRDTSWVDPHLNAGILSIRAWRYLRPFLASPNTIKLTKG